MHANRGFDFCLLDELAMQAHCIYLSDLRFLKQWERAGLARSLARVPADAATLFEWNDALQYLLRETPQETREAAREKLIASLAHEQRPCRANSDTKSYREGGMGK